jgi:hypothetical protein
MKLELQRLTFFGASSSAGLASAGLSASVALAGAPKVNGAAVEASLASAGLAGLIASVAAGAGTDVAAPKVNVAGFVAAGAAAGEDELSPKVKFLSTFSLSCPATEPNFTTSIPPSSSSRKE